MLNIHAASHKVQVLFLSGDSTICPRQEMVPDITTAVTKTGLGASTYCKAPGQVENHPPGSEESAGRESLPVQSGASGRHFTYEVTYQRLEEGIPDVFFEE